MNNWVVHLGWIVVILILSLCALVIYSPSGEVIKDYVSFAGAISSIILASIAIIYSFVSNQNIANATASLLSSVGSADDSARRVKESAAAIDDAVSKLRAEFGGIGPAVEGISKKLEEVTLPFSPAEEGAAIKAEAQKDLPLGMSPGVDATFYALALSHANNDKPLVFTEIFAGAEGGGTWVDYCLGVASALAASRPFGMTIHREQLKDGRRSKYSVSSWGSIDPDEIISAPNIIPGWTREAIEAYFR